MESKQFLGSTTGRSISKLTSTIPRSKYKCPNTSSTISTYYSGSENQIIYFVKYSENKYIIMYLSNFFILQTGIPSQSYYKPKDTKSEAVNPLIKPVDGGKFKKIVYYLN